MVTGAFHPELSSGGLQAHAVARRLHDRLLVQVLTTATDPALPGRDTIDGIPVSRVTIDRRRGGAGFGATAQMLTALLRQVPAVDLVHIQGYSAKNILVSAVSKMFGRPIVLHLQTSKHDEPPAIVQQGRLAWWAFRTADRYVSVSTGLRDAAVAGGIPAARIVEIPNGVDLSRFAPADAATQQQLRRTLGLPVDRPVVLFVGVMAPDKQPDVLFEAWTRLRTAPATQSALVFVGATDPSLFELEGQLAEQTRARAEQMGLRDRVYFVAPTRQIEQYYRAADLLVMPSLREGLPNVLLEAMACALPVVASRLPGSTETMMEDDVSGILVTPGEVGGFAGAIDRILSDAALGARLGAAARVAVAARYEMGSVAERWLAVYRDVLGHA